MLSAWHVVLGAKAWLTCTLLHLCQHGAQVYCMAGLQLQTGACAQAMIKIIQRNATDAGDDASDGRGSTFVMALNAQVGLNLIQPLPGNQR